MKSLISNLFVLTTLVFSLMPAAWAEVPTMEEMERVCQNWLTFMVHERGNWAGSANPEIVAVQEISSDGVLLGRCFSIAPRGYAVVPALKELPPVKAYSEDNGFDVNQSVGFPQLLREVLFDRTKSFSDAYGSLHAAQPRAGKILFDRKNRAEWNRYLKSPPSFASCLDTGPKITMAGSGPLLSVHWHQQDPFNKFCPMGSGGKCVVGCVATAAAQIMKFWNWPPSGSGSHQYTWDGDGTGAKQLSADFSDAYDWGNMHISGKGCNKAMEDAMAELCYEVGVAFEMDYGHNGSGSWTYKAVNVFPGFFRYDSSIDRENRDDYTATSWFNLIKGEIDDGRPMQYRIKGHSIVCDGWRISGGQNEYHINYGWGGSHNAWYAIDNIYGSDDPVNQEYLIRNIFPDTDPVFVVNPDGTGDFTTIQAAINAAMDGYTILVDPDTYYENIDFMGKDITVRSDVDHDPDTYDIAPSSTIIDGTQSGSVVTFESGEDLDAVLEGFTVKNGSGNLINNYRRGGGISCVNASPLIKNNIIKENQVQYTPGVWNFYGGGISCHDHASPAISNNVISNNYADSIGGGISCTLSSSPAIMNNTIEDNSCIDFGGGIYAGDSSPTVRGNTISGGECNFGAGIYCSNSTSLISDNHISDNYAHHLGGGICCVQNSPVVDSNVIVDNRASTGSGIGLKGSSATIVNNVLTGNYMEYGYHGGGIACTENSSPNITNNTLYDNSASGGGGGIYLDDSYAAVANTILWANQGFPATEIYLENGSTLDIGYCDITGITAPFVVAKPGCTVNWGSYVITSDPLFEDPLNRDFHLTAYSPCIDIGDNYAPDLPDDDFEGDPRKYNVNVDVGADEFSSLRTDVNKLLWKTRGIVTFIIEAGIANAYRLYLLLVGITGTDPGTMLPGGQTLPLNWDNFTYFGFQMANTPIFMNFMSTLDGTGYAEAQFDTLGPLPPELVGFKFYFAYTLIDKPAYKFVSNPVEVEIMDIME